MADLSAWMTVGDAAALIAALVLWLGYEYLLERSHWAPHSLPATLNLHRRRWMTLVIERENRISDSSLLGNLMHSISFFASASVLLLGATTAALGAVDRNFDMVGQVSFLQGTTKEQFEAKLIVLGIVFIYAFLKFTWSLQQFNYCCIALGAAPLASSATDHEKQEFVRSAARLNELGARSFNQGLRSYYFALACMGWFLHPLGFVAAIIAVLLMLWRRDFHSRTLRALKVS